MGTFVYETLLHVISHEAMTMTLPFDAAGINPSWYARGVPRLVEDMAPQMSGSWMPDMRHAVFEREKSTTCDM